MSALTLSTIINAASRSIRAIHHVPMLMVVSKRQPRVSKTGYISRKKTDENSVFLCLFFTAFRARAWTVFVKRKLGHKFIEN
jgi:hypothetical protein